jgi:hypothetical protein
MLADSLEVVFADGLAELEPAGGDDFIRCEALAACDFDRNQFESGGWQRLGRLVSLGGHEGRKEKQRCNTNSDREQLRSRGDHVLKF